jgi:hypothetical protein
MLFGISCRRGCLNFRTTNLVMAGSVSGRRAMADTMGRGFSASSKSRTRRSGTGALRTPERTTCTLIHWASSTALLTGRPRLSLVLTFRITM